MSYLPFHIHTSMGSHLDGLIKVNKLAERLSEYNIGAAMLTDHGYMSSCVDFSEALLKKNIKPIIGNEFYFSMGPATEKSELNRANRHMVVCATSKKGFKNLCKLTSRSNDEDVFYYKPRIDLNILEQLDTSDLLFFTGHFGSLLHAYVSQVSAAEQLKVGEKFLNKLSDIVGKENIYLEIQRICCPDNDYADFLTQLSRRTGIKVTACIDAHYVDRSEADNQRLLLASQLGTTLKRVKQKLGDNGLTSFFNNDYYHLPTVEEMSIHTDEELKNSLEIMNRCEEYSLLGQPILPKFCEDEEQRLKTLCEQGWNDILVKRNVINDSNIQVYKDRLNYELGVINEFGLAGYFLIVQDFISYARSLGTLAIPRGSAGGSLVSYLAKITYTDPIPNNLLFSRFLNKGRFTKNNIEYPDIDVDFSPSTREKVVQYIKNKYGHNNVANICNFSTLKGAGALSEVLRMHEVASFTEIKEMTKYIPKDAEISDQLEEQKEDSILRFTLRNMPAILESYCKYNDDGELVGEYAQYFKQAIEIEGSVKSQGVHAAGLIISPFDLSDICPLSRSKDGDLVTGLEMNAIKKIGLIKFDLLNTNVIEKITYTKELIESQYVQNHK